MSTETTQPTEQQGLTRRSVRDMVADYWLSHPAEATEKQERFLEGLAQTGTVVHAAEYAGINRQTAYDWRDLFPEFRRRWQLVQENVVDNVERSLYNQAVSEKNVVATIFYLKNNRQKYRDRLQVDVTAVQGEIEDRLSELGQQTAATSLPNLNAKNIIDEVIRGPLALPTKTTD